MTLTEATHEPAASASFAEGGAAPPGDEEGLRAFAEASTDALWIGDASNGRLRYLSPAFERLFGASRERIMAAGVRWVGLVHPEDQEASRGLLSRLRGGGRDIVQYRLVRPDGSFVPIRESGFPIRDADGVVRRVGGILSDVSDLRATAAALDDLRTLVVGIPQMVWRSCAEGRWTWASPQWLDYTGQTQEQSQGWGWLDVIHPDDRAGTMRAWHAARPNGELDSEYRVRRASDGAWRWHRTRSLPVRGAPTPEDPEGRILEWVGTTSDIEELKRSQAEGAVITEALQRHARDLVEVARGATRRGMSSAARDATDSRLSALARAKTLMTTSVPPSLPLRALILGELGAVGAAPGDRVAVEGPEVALLVDGGTPLVLAIHELAANAAQHGALVHPGGLLSIAWRTGESGEVALAWRESGVPLPLGPPLRGGYGTELIRRALPYGSGAETRLDFTQDGVVCEIVLPATMVQVAAAE